MRVKHNDQEFEATQVGNAYNLVSIVDPTTTVQMTQEEWQKNQLPTFQLAASMEFAAKALGVVSIASEFGDELYPIQAGEIKAGDKVYVKPMRKFGNVVRTIGEKYLVEASVGDATVMNPYFLIELEKRVKE